MLCTRPVGYRPIPIGFRPGIGVVRPALTSQRMSQSGRFANENTVEVAVRDADELGLVVPGARFGLARVDRGTDATRISSSFHPGVSSHDMDFGFSVLGAGAIDDSTLIVAVPTATGPTPTRWEGVEVAVGSVWVYGPGTTHHAADADGFRLDVLCVDYETLRETAEVLGVDIGDWEHRKAWLDKPDLPGRSIVTVGSELDPDADAGALLSSVALALSSGSFNVGSRRSLSSAEIVGRTFEYLDATGSWFPAIADLCRAVWVSERRLRRAFVDCFDRPPLQVLRIRALNAVHQALRDRTTPNGSVSDIATNHGFRHKGDFARYYRLAYGETPSQTLRTNNQGRLNRTKLGVSKPWWAR